MRPLLLDTCAVLRLANGEFRKFSNGAMKALREADVLYVSPILGNLPVVTTDRRFRDYGIRVIA